MKDVNIDLRFVLLILMLIADTLRLLLGEPWLTGGTE